MARAQRLEQTPRRFLDEVEDMLEAGRSAVVRVRHFLFVAARILEKQPELGLVLVAVHVVKNVQIESIHRQNVVESMHVLFVYLASDDISQRDSAPFRRGLRSAIRWFADVVRMRPSRVDVNMLLETSFADNVSKYAFGRR